LQSQPTTKVVGAEGLINSYEISNVFLNDEIGVSNYKISYNNAKI